MKKKSVASVLLALLLCGAIGLSACVADPAVTGGSTTAPGTQGSPPDGSTGNSVGSQGTVLPGSTGTSQIPGSSGTSTGPTVPGSSGGTTVPGIPTVPGTTTGPVIDVTTPPTQGWTPDARLTYAYAGYECAAFCWADTDPSACRVGYRLSGSGAYTFIDKPLIRKEGSTTVRADIVGLMGGRSYDFVIYSSNGTQIRQDNVPIASYDRSGYAHFGYTQGVGAYKDSGELKSGALVIYLTEDNKNNVLSYAYSGGERVDISAYMGGHTGIGELLNNRRYSGTDRFGIGIAKLCEVYGAVTIRVLGTVKAERKSDGTSTIVGLTDYNSTGNGGSIGDNGRMARMVDPKNLTIEGIGEDACVFGWGFHFIAAGKGGQGFEVRNLRFEDYPEDAVGMEGQQEGSTLTVPVQRCWIHHNSFYPGYCANPAESDKGEGDGSCDFKRGRYYTLSYNYFVDCHKTNLVGSSDSSLQYDITFHHNYWENCGSRIPLLRNANLHFYNNYISCDISKDVGSTGNKLALSYVSSVRANSYLFAENNYYDGCKNPVQTTSGGAVKAWGNTYYACYEDNMATQVSSRTEAISNNCKYAAGGIDYSRFDTDPAIFYYDAANQRSSCYMTDAVNARLEVLRTAGTMKHSGASVAIAMNQYTPASSLQMTGAELKVDFAGITAGSTVNGIYFAAKGSSGGIKGKGQVITFTLLGDTELQVKITPTGKEVNLGELVDSWGRVWAGKFTEFNGTLPAGTYFIASGSKDKEVTVNTLVFRSASTPAQKVAAVEAAINAIGTVTLSADCKAAIDNAQAAYNSLPADLQAQVSNASKLTAAQSQYAALVEAQAPAELKRLLSALPDSLTKEYSQQFAQVKALYDSIAPGKRDLTAAEQSKYDRLLSQYEAFKQEAVVAIFTGNDPSLAANAGFTVSGKYKVGVSFQYNGTTYERPLKMESATSITFTTDGSATLTLKLDVGGKKIKVDDVKYTADAEGFVTVTLSAGSHTITKGETCNLCYAILE